MKVYDTDKPNYLAEALKKVQTYKTPEKVLKYVQKQSINVIIGNPPYRYLY